MLVSLGTGSRTRDHKTMQDSTMEERAELTVRNSQWAKCMSHIMGNDIAKKAVKKISDEYYDTKYSFEDVHSIDVENKKSEFRSFIKNICNSVDLKELDSDSVFGLNQFVERGVGGNGRLKDEEKKSKEEGGKEGGFEEEEGQYECHMCWLSEEEGCKLVKKGCMCRGTNKTSICIECNLKVWKHRKEKVIKEKKENSLGNVYRFPITCDVCNKMLGEECLSEILKQWWIDISIRKKEEGESMDTVEEETYVAILEAEINEMKEGLHIENLNKVVEKLKEWNVEEGSEIMLQTKMTHCLLYMGMGDGERCYEGSRELLHVLNDEEKISLLDTNVHHYFMIQSNIFFSYSILFFDIFNKKKEQKIVWKKICESKKMLKFLEDTKNTSKKKVDLGTFEEQIKNIEYQYYLKKSMFEDAVKLGLNLLRNIEISHGKHGKEYKDFFQNLIYVMWKDESNMKLVQKSQIEFLDNCKWEKVEDRVRIVNGLQMLCRTINLHEYLQRGGKYELLKSLYWYAAKMSDYYGCDTFNCQMEVFFGMSIIRGIMAVREQFDENASETMYGCENTFTSEAMWFAMLYKKHPPNNVLNVDNVFLTKRNLGHSMSKIDGMPDEMKEKRLKYAVKLFREVYDQWVEQGEQSHNLFEKIKKGRLLDLQLAEKNLEMFNLKVNGKRVETRGEKLERLRMKIKESRR